MDRKYAYPNRVRNPLRVLLAAWRVSRDLANTAEAGILEIAFARSRLARGERQQVEMGRPRRVRLHDRLQAADARVVAGVPPGVGRHPELDEQARLQLAGGGEGHLVLGAVHHLAGVEGHHLVPAPPRELLWQRPSCRKSS